MNPIEFLQRHPPFDRLKANELDLLETEIEMATVPKGEQILVQEGEPSRYCYVIRSGMVLFAGEGENGEELEEGDIFGYSSLVGQESPDFTATAVSDLLLYKIPQPTFRILVDNVAFAEYLIQNLGERLRMIASMSAPAPGRNLATPLKYLSQKEPIFVPATATVQEAAYAIHQARTSSAFVQDEPPGILTDRDLRGRVLAQGLGPETPVRQIMSQPVKALDSDMPVYAGLLYMLEENIHHLALVEEGEIVGLVTATNILRHQAKSPLYLQRQLQNWSDLDGLAHYASDIMETVETLFHGGLDAAQIGQIISNLNDTVIKRLLKLAEEKLGPPPTPYAWIVLGSEGRHEQTLLTDQDNALVYAEESQVAQNYFSALSKEVINGLIQAGFPPCPGGYMATRWHKPLDEWIELFEDWIIKPKPQALMEASIFFDFYKVYGDLSLEPLENILVNAKSEGIFIRHMVGAAQEFNPPLTFFKRIRTDKDGLVDLKQGGIAPIVGLARACALAAGSLERSTVERLVVAAEMGTMSQEGSETLIETFKFLLRLRLQQQLVAVAQNQPPNNQVHVQSLSPLERRLLKEAFVTIRQMQDGIGAGF